jgi:hypothetical protein
MSSWTTGSSPVAMRWVLFGLYSMLNSNRRTNRARRKMSRKYMPLYVAEKALQQRRYCDAFALWRTCPHKACRRQRCCGGEAAGCLRRALDRVPHPEQWRARQDILKTTPRNIGAPERAARQCMPRDLYE